jgi:hypothetical protein
MVNGETADGESCSFNKKMDQQTYLVERSMKMGLFFPICDCGSQSDIGKVDGRRFYGGYFKTITPRDLCFF